MAQISYGTITITDTNDIENIIVEYNQNQSTSEPPAEKDSGWSTDRPTWAQGYYIWQRTRIHKSGTQASEDTFGAAVCLTGSTGQTGSTGPTGPTGQSLKSTKTQYTNVASNVTITTNNHTSYTWTDNVPAYNSSKPAYWARVTNIYTNPAKTEYLVYKDQGITDAIKTSYDANTKADDALDKADNSIVFTTQLWYQKNNTTAPDLPTNHSQVDNGSATYNNWRSTKPSYNSNYSYYFYCYEYKHGDDTYTYSSEAILDTSNLSHYEIGALDAKLKYFFYPGDSNYPGVYTVSGINGTTFNEKSISTYGYNVSIKPAEISLGYNNIKAIKIDGSAPSLKFYVPSKTTQATNPSMELSSSALTFNKIGTSNKAIELTNSALNFYGSSASTADATLTSTGLKLVKGGIEGGSSTSGNGYIYLSTEDKAGITINGHTPGTNNPKWRAVIGSKFGVDSEGNLYANEAHISGTFTVKAGSESNIYTKDESDSRYTDDTYAKDVEKDLHTNYYVKSDFSVAPDKISSTINSVSETNANAAKQAAIDDAASKYYNKTETYTKSEIEQKAGEISLSVAQEEVGKVISVKEASGNIVHVEDASDYPALDLKVHITPKQSGTGTPSPDNVRAISGWDSVNLYKSGKNLLVPKFYAGCSYNAAVGTTFALVDSSDLMTENNGVFSRSVSTWGGTAIISDELPTGVYRLSMTIKSTNLRATGYTLDGSTVTSQFELHGSGTSDTINRTITIEGRRRRIAMYLASSTNGEISFEYPQLELGTTATDYEPYTGTTTPVNLGLTVYGGTLDVVSGVLTVTHGYLNYNGSENWQADSNRYTIGVSGSYRQGYTRISVISNEGVFGTGSSVGTIFLSNTQLYYYPPTSVTSLAGFKTWLASHNLQVVYPLEQPQTYQLTPTEVSTLLGENNVWADAGDVYLKYASMNSDMHDLMNKSNADLKITADGISSEVSKKVGNDEVISKINQSAETVKIQASKVEIDGTAIFNAISDDVEDTIEGYGYQDASQVSTAVTNGVSGKADKTAAVAEEQYIYISKASGTTSVTGTTTWITAASDSQNTWTTKRPTYSSSYPVLFVAKQKKTVSGTVTCTTPVKDDTTTIIDGGHITTGTIDATKVTVTNLNADNITGGTLNIARVPDDALNSNVNVGGRNLLQDSDQILANGTVVDTKTYFLLYFWATPGQAYTGCVAMCDNVSITNTGKYIKTFAAKNDSKAYWCIKHNGTTNDFAIYFKNSVDVKTGDILTLSFDVIGCNPSVANGLEIRNFKLERGNKATDWTPAPEDVASDIDDASKVADNYLSFTESGGLDIGYTGDADAHGRTNIQGDGMRIYDKDDNVKPVARFTRTEAQIGRDGENRINLTSTGESLISDENVKWFEIKKSGRTVSDTYEYWESCRDETTFTLTKTPVAQCNIDIQIRLKLDTQVKLNGKIIYTAYARHTFIQGTTSSVQLNPVSGGAPSDAASNSYCTATYDSTNNSITISGLGSNVTSAGLYTIIYMAQTEAVDLGDFVFGTRNSDSYYASETATGTVSMGKNLVVTDPYQVVIGKNNSGDRSRDKLFVIGNGIETHSSNAFSVNKDGKVTASGGLVLGDEYSIFFYALPNDGVSISGNLDVAGNVTSAISACGAIGTADMALSTSEKKITLSTNRGKVGAYLSNSDGGVKCKKEGHVEISGCVYFIDGFNANDLVHTVIKKNSTNVINAVHRLPSHYDYYSVPPVVYDVNAGDILYLYVYNQLGNRGKAAIDNRTWLTVKYL